MTTWAPMGDPYVGGYVTTGTTTSPYPWAQAGLQAPLSPEQRMRVMRQQAQGQRHTLTAGPRGMAIECRALGADAAVAVGPAGEVRATDGPDGSFTITGHAAVYNRASENLGGFREVIEPGAFDRVLGDDVRLLIDHDPRLVLARTRSGTLKVGTDDRGLTISADAARTSYGMDLRAVMQRGDVDAMSFGFTVLRDEWHIDEDGNVTRTLLEIERLWDVSVVTFPAYPQTDAQARHEDVAPGVEVVQDGDDNGQDAPTTPAQARDPRRLVAWWRAGLTTTSDTEGART